METLKFKRGETIEITVLFDTLDNYGISSLVGVNAVCKIRPRHAREAVADMAVTVYPAENRLLLAMPPESSAALKEGLYTADITFTRVSDGFVQMSGDIAVEILKGTSNAG